jgi:Asp-tRNA(Asn)/Glu-tRNA(Gln) amidotransferase A subunit family amidase
MPYDLAPARVPRLTGLALQAVAAALDNPVTGAALAPRLLKDAGIAAFRGVVLEEPPSVLPDLPRPATLPAGAATAPPDLRALVEGATGPGGARPETVADFHAAYRSGRTTPEDVARALALALRAADAEDPKLRAITAWREDDLMAHARASSERWRAGKPRSPLDGVPIAVKEELDVAGYPTTVGTSFLGAVAAEDAAAVARLRAAGALLYGKANMIELGLDTLGYNAHHGTPRNPYGKGDRYSGGSSSGSGVAVSAGLGPIAVGADGGGSVRIPAALCGVVGLKATHGRISEKGVYPLCWSVGHCGPIGATVRDVALAYAVMAGPVAGDPVSMPQPPVTLDGLDGGVAGLKIGVYRAWFEDADPAVVRACQALVDGLVARGAEVVPIEIPELELARVAHVVTILSEMATSMDRYLDKRREHGAAVRINLAIARNLTGRDYVRAQMARTRASAHWARAFERCDVVATPTTGVVAPAIAADARARGEADLAVSSALMRFAAPMNLTGHPALSVPAGYDDAGLPIGLQLVGRPWEEHVILRVGQVTEALVARRAPRVGWKLLPASAGAE